MTLVDSCFCFCCPVVQVALEKHGTVYEGGYSGTHVAIRRFWDIVHEFDRSRKMKLLRFVTGASRAGIGGLGCLTPKLKIQRNGNQETTLLPTASTCFNTLLLPEYKSRGVMKEKLLVAIENASGFGLE